MRRLKARFRIGQGAFDADIRPSAIARPQFSPPSLRRRRQRAGTFKIVQRVTNGSIILSPVAELARRGALILHNVEDGK